MKSDRTLSKCDRAWNSTLQAQRLNDRLGTSNFQAKRRSDRAWNSTLRAKSLSDRVWNSTLQAQRLNDRLGTSNFQAKRRTSKKTERSHFKPVNTPHPPPHLLIPRCNYREVKSGVANTLIRLMLDTYRPPC